MLSLFMIGEDLDNYVCRCLRYRLAATIVSRILRLGTKPRNTQILNKIRKNRQKMKEEEEMTHLEETKLKMVNWFSRN